MVMFGPSPSTLEIRNLRIYKKAYLLLLVMHLLLVASLYTICIVSKSILATDFTKAWCVLQAVQRTKVDRAVMGEKRVRNTMETDDLKWHRQAVRPII